MRKKTLGRSILLLVSVIVLVMSASATAFAAPPPGTPGEDWLSDMPPTPAVAQIYYNDPEADLSELAPIVRMYGISSLNSEGFSTTETAFEMAFVAPELAARYYTGELTEWPSPELIVAGVIVTGGAYEETLPVWWETCATLWGQIYG